MKTVIRILLVLLLLAFTVMFNFGVVDVRLDELDYLLGKMATMQDVSNSLGIIGKYELIKRRMLYGEENNSTYELEAKVQALTSEGLPLEKKEEWGKKLYLAPVRFTLNVIRVLLGKQIVNPKDDDKILNVLEIGYFWERNRKYVEAIKVYDQVLAQNVRPEIKAAVMIHKAFCHSMLSEYDISKRTYERVISEYPNTEAGILSWKLLDFIESMEKQRSELEVEKASYFDKAKQFYLLMDYRNSIKYFSIFLQQNPPDSIVSQAEFYEGRSHEELGENDEAMAEYRNIIRTDKTRIWAKQANRRMLMMGEFYEQKKEITDEAKRQLALYQDQSFINKVEQYASLVSQSSLRQELMGGDKNSGAKPAPSASDDSLLNVINKIGSLDLTGEKAAKRQEEIQQMREQLMQKGTLSAQDLRELERRKDLEDNPFRRPSVLKETIDENSSQLKYLYNKKLRQGIKLSGKMVVSISILPDGAVGKAVVMRSSMGDKTFENDIVKQITTWKFKPVSDSLGVLTVNYPFEFYQEE